MNDNKDKIWVQHSSENIEVFCMGGSSTKEMAAPIVVAAKARHTATLIFLHGLGDTGVGWAEAFRQLNLQHIKCVCPTAPIMPVTLNAGFRMPSWFDIYALSAEGPQDEPGIKSAAALLNDLISNEEKNGIKSENVIVGGFSQGGAVALYTALTSQRKLAGVIGLSCWLPLHKEFPQGLKTNRDIPVFQGHGSEDPLVPTMWGELTAKLVKQMSEKHTFKTYPMMHTSCQEEMDDLKQFLDNLVSNLEGGQSSSS